MCTLYLARTRRLLHFAFALICFVFCFCFVRFLPTLPPFPFNIDDSKVVDFNRINTNLIKIIDRTGISSARHPVFSNGLQDHTLFDTLFKAAVLTPVSLCLCDLAATLCHARIHPPILYSPFEETFAPAAAKIDRCFRCCRCF